MEVNLAVFIMAAGVLAMVSLYPLGYRESQQSVDDVRAAAYADFVFNQIAAVMSSRTLTWQEWKQCVDAAVQQTNAGEKGGGWGAFCNTSGGYAPKDRSQINSKSKQVFDALMKYAGKAGVKQKGLDSKDLTVAIVAQKGLMRFSAYDWQDDNSRIMLSLRVSRNASSLFGQPLFFTEIHFQGDQQEVISGK